MYIDYNKKLLFFAYFFFKYNIRRKYQKYVWLIYFNKIIDYYNEINFNKFKMNFSYDKEQLRAIYTSEAHTFVIAGAGSGKTSLIVGKVNYLIEQEKLKENEILCLSFTNAACDNLKRKLLYDVDVLTFHKLALNILHNEYKINNNYLKYIINEYFEAIVIDSKNQVKKLLKIIGKHNFKKYKLYLSLGYFDSLKELISKFIHLFITNGYDYSSFLKFKNNKDLLSIIIDIYYLYITELDANKEVDLDTLIIKAIDYSENIKFLKYIIIDEFQDISKIRMNLISAIIKKTNSKLLAVGDDYQSIYGFSGSNINEYIKLCHNNYDTKVIKLKNNYRCCQELVYVANKFVMKNKNQIKKNINCFFSIKKPIIIIKEKLGILEKLLINLSKNKKDILILGRNNNDIKNYINPLLILNINKITNCNIFYKTIHSAKGLEADCVIIINLKDDKLGFPSQIVNHDVISYVTNVEEYEYAEERRLFYVALTRSKGEVYLLEPLNKSIFLKELKRNNKQKIHYLSL